MPDGHMRSVLHEVMVERERQDAKWGDQSHKPFPLWVTILAEEFGEVANAILESDFQNAYVECVQTAAVATAMAEALVKQGVAVHPAPLVA